MMDELMNEGLGDVNEVSDLPAFTMDETEEMAPSMEVQVAEIRDVFMDMPELQLENWKKLDIDERATALQNFENSIAEIEHRPPTNIVTENLEDNVMGYFYDGKIAISRKMLGDDANYKITLNTLLHEGRHAYQHYNLEVKQIEQNSALVDSWRTNLTLLGYESGDWPDYQQIGFWRYQSQPVEVDARAFADAGMRAIKL